MCRALLRASSAHNRRQGPRTAPCSREPTSCRHAPRGVVHVTGREALAGCRPEQAPPLLARTRAFAARCARDARAVLLSRGCRSAARRRCVTQSFMGLQGTCWFKPNTAGQTPSASVTAGVCHSTPTLPSRRARDPVLQSLASQSVPLAALCTRTASTWSLLLLRRRRPTSRSCSARRHRAR